MDIKYLDFSLGENVYVAFNTQEGILLGVFTDKELAIEECEYSFVESGFSLAEDRDNINDYFLIKEMDLNNEQHFEIHNYM